MAAASPEDDPEAASARVDGPRTPPARNRRSRSGGRLLATYLVTVILLVSINFWLPRIMPGDPISALDEPTASTYVRDDTTRTLLERHYGLDRPLVAQYGRYLTGLAHGELGTSIRYQVPVRDLVGERLPWTLLLTMTAMALAGVLGLAAGVHSGWHRGRGVDRGLLGLFLALRNFPVFFLGSMALLVFAVKLRWFPLAGAATPFAPADGLVHRVVDIAHHLVLPATVLATQLAASQYLVMRAGMVAELGSDYLLVGRAKGLSDRRLMYRYASRNALLPVVTVLALQLSFTVTEAIFIETVFAYPGMGRLVFDAVAFRDYPVLQGCFLVLTLMVVTANFGSELLYSRLDPRVSR